MLSFIEQFTQPTHGHEQVLPNGDSILVSVRKLVTSEPNHMVIQVNDLENGSLSFTGNDTLLVEARDPEALEDETIAHCVFHREEQQMALTEVEVAYGYRNTEIVQNLIAIAANITGIKMQEFGPDSFRYL